LVFYWFLLRKERIQAKWEGEKIPWFWIRSHTLPGLKIQNSFFKLLPERFLLLIRQPGDRIAPHAKGMLWEDYPDNLRVDTEP
jgi:hypothetical protein